MSPAIPPARLDLQGTATLIFNTNAGGSETCSPDHLVEELHKLGFRPVYRATDSEDDLERALTDVHGTVFVAGGDGTIRAAAVHLAGRPDITLGVIPMGTANNIGRMLGVQGHPLEVVASYRNALIQPFDVGRVTAPWGEDLFLEACGCGAFADVMAEYDPEEGKSPVRAAQALSSALREFEPVTVALSLDGEALPEMPYVLLEVMNTKATGPRLRMATSADTQDGLLDVIRIAAHEREGVLAYLAALARDDFEDLPSVQATQARVIDIPYHGQAFHIDGEVRPPEQGGMGNVRIEVWPGALQVLVPSTEDLSSDTEHQVSA
ncbi:diacylglycerol kinase family protein [Deinococcus deserti]|uniref:Putative diacylglycerol kinase n=1 Tax=Deinococcus deserti (strain DSM 17065 / CIP 109153 / LMG 22923 / VCD115) TaxID=546414 RepID=C1D0C1_DEIDV|nr:diacylglycerol kinase family protein [Deinococcus deserti]ACO45295.1 putative diacylglycerol kinase [Deinococcus deserti VCD115]